MNGAQLYFVHQEAWRWVTGETLPNWDSLEWVEQLRWEDRAVEQGLRDFDTLLGHGTEEDD